MNRKSLLSRHSYAFFFACFLFFLQAKTSHAQAVTVEPQRYQIDNSLKLIVCNQIPEFPSGQPLPTLRFDKEYTFTQPVSAFEVGKSYKVKTISPEGKMVTCLESKPVCSAVKTMTEKIKRHYNCKLNLTNFDARSIHLISQCISSIYTLKFAIIENL